MALHSGDSAAPVLRRALHRDAATEAGRKFRPKATRIIFGHRSAVMTEVYAERDEQEAIAAIMKAG